MDPRDSGIGQSCGDVVQVALLSVLQPTVRLLTGSEYKDRFPPTRHPHASKPEFDPRKNTSSCHTSSIMSANLTEDDWNSRKDTIRSLYLVENRKLQRPDGVMEEMMNKYGFKAT
jgi:hypothetical protein